MRKALITLAGLAMAAGAHANAATESELHIEARGGVTADYAVITMDVFAAGRGKPAADAQIKAQIARLKARMLKAGIPESAVTLTPPVVEERKADEDSGPFNSYAMREAIALEMPAYGTADAVDDMEDIVESADGAADAAQAAVDAARAAAIEARRRKARKLPWWDARFTATIRVDDLRAFPGVAESLGIRGGPGGGDNSTDFRFREPATVHARAVADALAKARAEAEVYAKAMGGRVVRIARVSNTETPISGPEVFNLISTMDNRKQLWRVPATHSASVAVDFVVAVD